MANRDFVVFDFETGSRNPHRTQPTQIAALAIDGRNLIAAGFDPLEDEALKITGKTREGLANAPSLKSVWSKFTRFVDQYNWKGDSFYAPIPVGFNIIGFDLIIVNRLCKEFGPWDKD
ncbi:3'-5' exonuclease, partial [bacterium]|nr:3'-5' exonuclease [bacterium]